MSNHLAIQTDEAWLEAEAEGLDTVVTVMDDEAEALIALSWTQAVQLHKWLGKRLSE